MRIPPLSVNNVIVIVTILFFIGCVGFQKITFEPNEIEYKLSDLDNWNKKLQTRLENHEFFLKTSKNTPNVEGWSLATSFIHVSDVQLRDYGVKFFGKKQEKWADIAVGGTRRNELLDKNDEYPFIALVGALKRPGHDNFDKPDFLIHTGDSVDTGTAGELLYFISIANKLDIPWFNVIGNHDVFLMGNFTDNYLETINRPDDIQIINSRKEFITLHNGIPTRNLSLPHPPTESQSNLKVPRSKLHGFDFADNNSNNTGTYRSYYSFKLSTRPNIRVIVLDTIKRPEQIPHLQTLEAPGFGANGFIALPQFQWLIEELKDSDHKDEKAILFGHHPLSSVGGGQGLKGDYPEGGEHIPILDVLKKYPNVLGYFCGHTHKPKIIRHEGVSAFIEVIAPSLHEYPQIAFHTKIYFKEGSNSIINVTPIKGGVNKSNTWLYKKVRNSCLGAIKEASKDTMHCWMDNRYVNAIFEVGDEVFLSASTADVNVPPTNQNETQLKPMENIFSNIGSPRIWFDSVKFYIHYNVDKRPDGTIPEIPNGPEIKRSYKPPDKNQRNVFGVGWHHQFENHIDFETSMIDDIHYKDDSHTLTHFKPSKHSDEDIKKIKQLIVPAPNNNPMQISDQPVKLKDLVNANKEIREKLFSIIKNIEYKNTGFAVSRLIFTEDSINVYHEKKVFHFDMEGRLQKISEEGKKDIDMIYFPANKIVGIRQGKSHIELEYNDNDLVRKAKYDEHTTYTYTYDDLLRLHSVMKGDETIFLYKYNEENYITEVQEVNGMPLFIKYNEIGWLSEMTKGDKRIEWKYQETNNDNKEISKKLFVRDGLVKTTRYHFDYFNRSIKIKEGENPFVVYHLSECACKPIDVTKNGITTYFIYDENGDLRKKYSNQEKIDITYENEKVKEISILKSNGKDMGPLAYCQFNRNTDGDVVAYEFRLNTSLDEKTEITIYIDPVSKELKYENEDSVHAHWDDIIYIFTAVQVDTGFDQINDDIENTNFGSEHLNLKDIDNITIREGEPVLFEISPINTEQATYTYSATNLPLGAAFDQSSGVFKWTPRHVEKKKYNIKFTITDNGSPPKYGQKEVLIIVSDANRPPLLSPISSHEIMEGEILEFTVSGSDVDGDTLTYSASDLPSGATLDSDTGFFKWVTSKGASNTYQIKFTVSDNGDPPLDHSMVVPIVVKKDLTIGDEDLNYVN